MLEKKVFYLFHSENPEKYFFFPEKSDFLQKVMQPSVYTSIWPSAFVRSLMHAHLIEPFKPRGWQQICTNSTEGVKNSIVIVHKKFFRKRAILRQLKRQNNYLVYEMIERATKNLRYADAIVSCTRKSFDYYTSIQKDIPVFFCEHCVDPRVKPFENTLTKFSGYYFGAKKNFLCYNSVFPYIRPYFTDLPYPASVDWIPELHKANFHYAVRPILDDPVFKPFTKGFIAATCSSNILVHEDDGDARYYLGNDYPYLIKGELNEEVVRSFLERAKEEFGGKVWRDGLEIMRQVLNYVSPQTIAQQFWSMIDSIAQSGTGRSPLSRLLCKWW